MKTSRSTVLFGAFLLSMTSLACGGVAADDDNPGGGGSESVARPVVTSTNPVTDGTDAPLNVRVAVTFSEAMDAETLTADTFTVKHGTEAVAGTVALSGLTAMFTPTSHLEKNELFTATITSDAKSAAGKALQEAYTWSFRTGTSVSRGPAPVGLGAAGDYAVLAKTAVSTVPSSGVTGDIGLSPAAASFITGFSLVADATNVFSTTPQVVGQVFAADYAVPTPSNLTTAVSNMEAAYSDAAGRPTPDFLELGTGDIGGLTLEPGLYKWTSTVTIPTDVTIEGGANDVWIFQTTGDLSMDARKTITLAGGAKAKNIFWQVAGEVTLGANSHFEGVVLTQTAITLQTGATMNGRLLAQTAVALQQVTVTQPAP